MPRLVAVVLAVGALSVGCGFPRAHHFPTNRHDDEVVVQICPPVCGERD